MTKSEHPLAISSHHKIQVVHVQRLAYIYIRQPTVKQVEHNRGSQANQYQLTQRAEALGWNPDRIRVIDIDQGLSGRGSEYRQGFQELVAEVSLDHVGIVFGYKVSRLARNYRDWYHLLDLAAVFGTLIADCDGVYDPRLYNDRLLLGLEGTMSEAELHLLRQRLDAGRMSRVLSGSASASGGAAVKSLFADPSAAGPSQREIFRLLDSLRATHTETRSGWTRLKIGPAGSSGKSAIH